MHFVVKMLYVRMLAPYISSVASGGWGQSHKNSVPITVITVILLSIFLNEIVMK